MEAILDAIKRSTKGKNEARRLRAAGKIPAVLYGAQKAGDQPAPEPVSFDPKPFMRILHSKSGLNTLITLKLQGVADTRVLVKNVQLDPITHHPLHADLFRVNMDRKITVTVPILLKGESRGVKQDGGVLDFVHREIELEVLPADIPDSIEVDISDLGIGDSVHVRDLAANASWTPISDPDMMILHVVVIKVVEEAAPAAGAEGAAAAAPAAGAAATAGAAEPEVIKKGKTDKEGDAKDAKKDDKKK
ncbi:MAG TPA: 50S ribosomal protein L25 [Vicinamibacterales bacterium]|nr:50S ribosomal protein L25 [Vicinamibacterales bacterium]